MKNLLYSLFAFLIVLSCRDDDFGKGATALQPVDFTVSTHYDSDLNAEASPGTTVVLTNTGTGDVYTQNANETGQAAFTQILPGNYTVTATSTLSRDQFTQRFGYDPQVPEVHFNGVQENVTVNVNVTSTLVALKTARLGNLVIKQIYYSGSHTTQGAMFRDQFIEIYNNSNETLYADGLYIAQLFGKINTTTADYTLPNGQYDWSKSLGMSLGSKANTDYVYADYVIQIPGTGISYPIEPGESFLVAATGVNHKAPLLDNTGDPIEVRDPSLTVDLSGADFEVYLGDFRESIGEAVFKSDIQNPAVPDVQIAYWGIPGYYSNNKDLLMDSFGRDSFAIFRTEDFASFGAYTNPSVTTVSSNSSYFKQIPSSLLIDGVELQHYNPSSPRPKMLTSSVDAGHTNTDAAYNSQSVIRKTKTTLPSGRKILEDTNNSSNDFIKLEKATPKGFAN
ncbi:DUF4876 domain-containing protein [Chryseobacterium sp. A301]